MDYQKFNSFILFCMGDWPGGHSISLFARSRRCSVTWINTGALGAPIAVRIGHLRLTNCFGPKTKQIDYLLYDKEICNM